MPACMLVVCVCVCVCVCMCVCDLIHVDSLHPPTDLQSPVFLALSTNNPVTLLINAHLHYVTVHRHIPQIGISLTSVSRLLSGICCNHDL